MPAEAPTLWLLIAAGLALILLVLWRQAAGARAREAADAAARLRAADERLTAARDALGAAAEARRATEGRLAEQADAREAQALRAAEAETRLDSVSALLRDRSAERDGLAETLQSTRAAMHDLQQQLGQTRLAAQKDAEAAAREIATLRELRKEMTDQFRLLADEAMRTTGTDIQTRHAEQLSALLTPFREQVATFQTELQTREAQATQERAALGEHIRLLHARSEQIGADAVALTRALKGEKQKQGAWGEMILSSLLEDSGLEAGVHFITQDSRTDDEGRRWRPDVILKLPQGKVVVVDSKVSLNAYVEASEAEDPGVRDAAMKRHLAAVRAHVQQLSDKGYDRLDEGSVDYVMMFMPVEGAYYEAQRLDRSLVGWALQKRVSVMTPATLMLALRTVHHIWTVERRESNAAAIAARAGQLYDKVAGFVDAMDDVGKHLDKAQASHRSAVDRLSRGSGNVIRQVEMLRKLGANTDKRLAIQHDGDDDDAALPGAGAAPALGSAAPE